MFQSFWFKRVRRSISKRFRRSRSTPNGQIALICEDDRPVTKHVVISNIPPESDKDKDVKANGNVVFDSLPKYDKPSDIEEDVLQTSDLSQSLEHRPRSREKLRNTHSVGFRDAYSGITKVTLRNEFNGGLSNTLRLSKSAYQLLGPSSLVNEPIRESASECWAVNECPDETEATDEEANDSHLHTDTSVSSQPSNPRYSEHVASSDDLSQVQMRQKGITRKMSMRDELTKRLSLPSDIQLPESFAQRVVTKLSPDEPLNRRTRRASLQEIGFGREESYTKLDKLGEGTYATVYKGKSLLTENVVALKEIRLEHEEGAPCTAIREVSLLRDLRHANIVTLHDIIHTPRSLTLVFEYMERDLKQYMDECGGIMHMLNVKLFTLQLMRGLAYCHQRRVLHRDLKPQNLLINDRGELKLADFGLARAKSIPTKTYSHEVITLWYRPPDILLGSTEYSTHIDMWGVGCIFYEMCSGRPLFPSATVDEQFRLIFKVLGTPTEQTWPGISMNQQFKKLDLQQYSHKPQKLLHLIPRLDSAGVDLLKGLLRYDTSKRISAADGLRHEYFTSLGSNFLKIPDTTSIFTLPNIHLHKDPGIRNSLTSNHHGKNRRQSMLF